METTIMTNEQHGDDRNAQVVPLHPDREHDAPGGPGVLPAVPGAVSYEIELDAPPESAQSAIYVDVTTAETRLPVIPPQWRGMANIRATLVRHKERKKHQIAYHGLRLPVYLVRALAYAAAGALRLGWRHVHWAFLAEAHPLRSQVIAEGDHEAYLKLHHAGADARRARLPWTAAGTVVLVGGIWALAVLASWWAWLAAAGVAVPLLARYGHAPGKSVIGAAVVTPRFRKLTADIVLRAYYAAKLGDPEKPGQQVTFGTAMARDGDGSRVTVDLPYGKGLKDAVDAKDKIASGLDVTESQVFIHRDPTSTRRHVLWVADRDPLAVPVGRTPLLACRPADIWEPAPMGLDERGQLVSVPLMWNSVLISALPRSGKTFAARLLALYCALDPHVKMSVFDAKGSPDWRKFSLVADSFAFGLTPTRYGLPGDILLAALNDIKADVQDRYRRLSEMPTDVCPEGKLTREMARDPRYRMPVRVLVLEEFQEYLDMGDASKEIAALLVFLVKVAPGAGVILIDATQRPSGVGTGQVAQQFTSFRDNHAIRFGLRTSSWQVSDLCLGAGAYSEGLDTSTLLPQYKGVGILKGATDASPTVRTYLADGQDAERILVAARALREHAGTLSGMALGEDTAPDVMNVLADVLMAFEPGEPGLHWAVLAGRLAARFPDRWAGASGDAASARVRKLGVPSVDVKMSGVTVKGCRKADVQEVVARP
jgi:S-DNA-T family DNA segregation ATPase FtsK/SpoIIIE